MWLRVSLQKEAARAALLQIIAGACDMLGLNCTCIEKVAHEMCDTLMKKVFHWEELLALPFLFFLALPFPWFGLVVPMLHSGPIRALWSWRVSKVDVSLCSS